MAYTVSSTPSASAQTLNKAFQGIIELPANLREIEKQEYLRKLEETKQARAQQYADAQLRAMDMVYQNQLDAKKRNAEMLNAFNSVKGQSPDVVAKTLAPFLIESGNIGTLLNLQANADAYAKQQKVIADQNSGDALTSQWFNTLPKSTFAQKFAPSPTEQDVAKFVYGSNVSPEAKKIALENIVPFIGKPKGNPQFGMHNGQPYVIQANGSVVFGSRQPVEKTSDNKFPKYIQHPQTGEIIPITIPGGTTVDKDGKITVTGESINPAYSSVYKMLNPPTPKVPYAVGVQEAQQTDANIVQEATNRI